MENKTSRSNLDRYLSPTDVWALSLGCIIGWGAFVMPGTTFLPVAGPLGTVMAMAISAAVMLVIGFNYFYLMKQYPGIGGVYAYSRETLGRDHAFLSSWFLCLSYLSLIPQNATILAVMCRTLWGDAVRGEVHYTFAGADVYLGEIGLAIVALVVIGLLAVYRKRLLQRMQTLLALVLLIGVIAIAVCVLPHIRFDALFSLPESAVRFPFAAVTTIIIMAPWAFVGFEVISLETAHFRFPVKQSGRLIVLSILLGAAIYSAMALTAVSVQPEGYQSWQSYVGDLDRFSGVASIPTFYAMQEIMGDAGVWIIGVTAMSAVLSSVAGFYRASARILMNLAEDRILTAGFKRPRFCFLFLMTVSIVICAFGRRALQWVVDLSSFGAIVGFGYASTAVYRLAKQKGERRETITGVVGILLAVGFAVAQLVPGISMIETMSAESYLLLALWCLAGFAFYWRAMSADAEQKRGSESTTIAALIFLLIFSAVIWYVKKLTALRDAAAVQSASLPLSAVLLAIVLSGLAVMLLIHAQLRKRQMRMETEKIRAIENSQAKSRFLFNMSHDIRTPMNAIIGYVHLARKEPTTPAVSDYLDKIDLSSQHMLFLINDILEMSRIESGRLELEEAPCDLQALFGDIGDLFSEQMKQKRIGFSADAAQLRHPCVRCDKKLLNRALLNLLSNAYKFTPEGGAVAASIREIDSGEANRGQYEIRVWDSGIGMSPEFSEKMFNAFERERTSTDSGLEGTGLGLAITKSIIDLMGGTIEVNTAPGEGSEFIVRVGFALADEADLPTERAPETPEEAAPDLTQRRLLLVEDNEINREIAGMILTQEGFLVENADNGQVALDMVAASQPGYYDAVLMDIQMPVMNGYDATRAIRTLEDPGLASVPVVAMTANAFQEDIHACMEAGMQGHIAKPIDVDVMLKTLGDVLAQHDR